MGLLKREWLPCSLRLIRNNECRVKHITEWWMSEFWESSSDLRWIVCCSTYENKLNRLVSRQTRSQVFGSLVQNIELSVFYWWCLMFPSGERGGFLHLYFAGCTWLCKNADWYSSLCCLMSKRSSATIIAVASLVRLTLEVCFILWHVRQVIFMQLLHGDVCMRQGKWEVIYSHSLKWIPCATMGTCGKAMIAYEFNE